MPSDDPFGLLIALAMVLFAAFVGGAALWAWDYVRTLSRWRRGLDRCLTCGKRLRYRPATRDYRPHRCRTPY